MKAILSDIHSNLEAFQAVLEDISQKNIDEIYCLGDVVGYGPNPRECLKMAREFQVIIRGNHESALFQDSGKFNPKAKGAIDWTREQLEQEEDMLEYVKSLNEFTEVEGVMCVHGSPLEPTSEYIIPAYAAEKNRLRKLFEFVPNFCFVGHTHIPGIFTDDLNFTPQRELLANLYMLEPGKEKAIINVGSVGQPRDRDPRACYVTFDGDSVVYRRVEYDLEQTAKKIFSVKSLDNSLGRRLVSGM